MIGKNLQKIKFEQCCFRHKIKKEKQVLNFFKKPIDIHLTIKYNKNKFLQVAKI